MTTIGKLFRAAGMAMLLSFAPLADPGAALAAGQATWLSETRFVASSLETGMIGYLEAWGGAEFGYAYSYAIRGGPAGLVVDTDSGMLSITTPVAAGSYSFTAAVRNRKDTAKVANFTVTLQVLAGITAGTPTASQILHKTYLVDSGIWGLPTGSDYTTVLLNIRKALINDQASAGEEKLRATIVFESGRQYDYTDNRWPFGMQYLDIRTTTAGLRARLRNVGPLNAADVASVILQLGRPYFQCVTPTSGWICDDPRAIGYQINTTTIGGTSITLKNASDASAFTIGRYAMIGSYDQQMGGHPPNIRYFDYARVSDIDGATITLDRPLRFVHKSDYWEDPNEPTSLGVARIYAIDRNDQRTTLRANVEDIEFVGNPNTNSVRTDKKLYASALTMDFRNCIIPDLVPSQARFMRVIGGSILDGELDKLISVIVFDTTTVAGLHEGTGINYLLFKASHVTSGYGIAPRQLRVIGSILNGTTYAPLSFKGEWTTQQVDVRNSAFVGTGPVFAEWPAETLTIGSGGVTWDGSRLSVPTDGTATAWQAWGRAAWEGAIVYADDTNSPSWGVITDITGNATTIYFDIDWKAGAQPTTNTVLLVPRLHDLSVTQDMPWNDSDAGRQIAPVGTRPFPTGYSASMYGF